jgi:hypothetical protein
MNSEVALKHQFVEFIPDDLEQRTIYVSIRFATASHLCLCGCGNKVVTPIRPADWTLMFDGKMISLDPSIGNWSFPCKSHYWIRKNRIKWAPRWSPDQIERGRQSEGFAKEYYGAGEGAEVAAPQEATQKDKSWRRRLRKLFNK